MNRNFKKLTNLFNYINIKASHIYHARVGTEWHFRDHCHNFNRIYVILDGSGVLSDDNENITMVPGNIYVIPANHRYSCRCDDHLEKFFIHFTATIQPQRDLLSGTDRIITLPISSRDAETLRQSLYAETIESALRLQCFVRDIAISSIGPDMSPAERDMDNYLKYKQLFEYIESNLYADISVSEACRYAGFSQTYLGQRFKADTGQSIKQYITLLLTDRICELLLFTELPLSEIAKALHFESESYFSKFFKKHKGITAREYRKRQLSV